MRDRLNNRREKREMTLNEFLSTLNAKDVQVSLIDSDGKTEIITFKATGYASLEDTLEARTIREWTISSPILVKVILEAETT